MSWNGLVGTVTSGPSIGIACQTTDPQGATMTLPRCTDTKRIESGTVDTGADRTHDHMQKAPAEPGLSLVAEAGHDPATSRL